MVDAVIVEVVSPVDQLIFVADEDVNWTDPPIQKDVGPLAVIVGAVGLGSTVIVVEVDVVEAHPLLFT